jgi:hypothetical protein
MDHLQEQKKLVDELSKEVSFQKRRAAEPGRVIQVEEKVHFSGQPVEPKEQVF